MKIFTLSCCLIMTFCSLAIHAEPVVTPKDTTHRMKELSLNEVVIVAGKQPETLANLPAAVSYIGHADINDFQIVTLRNLTSIVPNLFMPSYGSKLTDPVYIRGVGSRINDPSVGLYVDNVPYFNKSTFVFDFNDVERVEILRGPQGTLYGRNTMGGLINIITRMPSFQPSTDFTIDAGNYNLQRYSLSMDQPLIDHKLAMLVSGDYTNHNGYYINHFNNSKVGSDETMNGMLKLRYTPTENLSLLYKLSGDKSDENGYPYGVIDSTGKAYVNYNHPSFYRRRFFDNSLTATYTKNNIELTSATSFQYMNDDQDIDQDFSPADIYTVTQLTTQHSYSQEFRADVTKWKNWTLTGGVFGFRQSVNGTINLRSGAMPSINYDKMSTQTNEGVAGYGQATLNSLLHFIDVTFGLRYDYEHNGVNYLFVLRGNPTPVVATDTLYKGNFSQWTPKIALRFKTGRETSIYATWSKGYRGGGFNFGAARPQDLYYKPEYSYNYEVGFKGSFWDGKLTTNADLFYIDWRSQQVSERAIVGNGNIYQNAGKTFSKGAEAEVVYHPINEITFGGSAGITQAKYLFFQPDHTKSINYGGNHLPFVPLSTYSVYTQLRLPIHDSFVKAISLNAAYNGVGKIYWDDANTHSDPAYQLLDGSISFEGVWGDISIWSKNLANTSYHAYLFQFGSNWYGQQGTPTTFGISYHKRF